MSDDKDLNDKNDSKENESKLPVSDKSSVDKVVSEITKTEEKTNDSSEQKSSEKVPTAQKEPPAQMFNPKSMPKMNAKKPRKNYWLVGITTLLILIAILVAVWNLYQQQLSEQRWDKFEIAITTQLAEQNKQIASSKNMVQSYLKSSTNTEQKLNRLVNDNKQLSDALFSTQERIKALSGRQKQDWMLAEAAYLIKVAQLQLTLQKDKSTAIQLLRTADSRITEMADNSLTPIRQAIAQDLSDLNLILEPDVTGMSLALDAINKQIPNLAIIALQFEPLENALPEVKVEQQGFSLEKIYNNFLKDFVVIKEHGEPVKPLMTADQRINLNNNIQLAIQQAQIALAQRNERLYRLNISNAIDWTQQFFTQDEKTKAVIEQLNQLKIKPVETHYPNKLAAKAALDSVSQQQVYRWLENAMSNSSGGVQTNQAINKPLEPLPELSKQPSVEPKTQDSNSSISRKSNENSPQPNTENEQSVEPVKTKKKDDSGNQP